MLFEFSKGKSFSEGILTISYIPDESAEPTGNRVMLGREKQSWKGCETRVESYFKDY
jgi:hypothetical protein